MIEFLQDYQTKAIPPEVFKKGERHERSSESELYFARLGVAGYVVDGQVVDADYKPIAVTPVVAEVVTAADRRFSLGGRAGELPLGIAAPQRASTGPGNEVLFGGDQSTAAAEAELTRLGAALTTAGEDLLARVGERDQALADLATVTAERDRLAEELREANAEDDEAVQRESALREQLEASTSKISDLERELGAARAEVEAHKQMGAAAADGNVSGQERTGDEASGTAAEKATVQKAGKTK